MLSEFPAAQLREVLQRARQTLAYQQFPLPDGDLTLIAWENLGQTSKEDLRRGYPFGHLAVPRRELSTYHESSGTSGQPIASYFTESDWQDVHSRFLRTRVNLSGDDTVLIKTPYALVTTAHQMHGAALRVGATVVPADNRSSNMPYARVLRLLRDLQVTLAWCLPTEALLWAYLARRSGFDLERDFKHLRAFLVAGEVLSLAKKKTIARVWGGKLIAEDYGSTETGSLAGECSAGFLHLWTDRIFCELDQARHLGPATSEGILLVTPLERQAMPLVRYNTGDEVRVLHEPCPCGSSQTRVEILGRVTDVTGGVRLKDVEQAIYSADVAETIWFWRARPGGSSHHHGLEVEIHSEGPHAEQVAREVQESLRRQVDPAARVQAVGAEEFVSPSWLSPEQAMQKPRYLFAENEKWNGSLTYA